MKKEKQIIRKNKMNQLPEVELIKRIASISEHAEKSRLSFGFNQTKIYKV